MWIRRKKKRRVPGLNTTATADISFMLLAFFLMVSSMDVDKGLHAQLPAKQTAEEFRNLEIAESNVLRLAIDATDTLRCNGTIIAQQQLLPTISAFVERATDDHIILISADSATTFDAYFHLQHTIARAYLDLRNQLATQRYNKEYRACTPSERAVIDARYPWRVSEEEPSAQETQSAPTSSAGEKTKGGAL